MAVLAFAALLLLAMAGQSSANWCVCKEGLGDAVWQKTLDYACGAGADCNPIHSNGGCYNPNTVKAHCNYAVNSYFQKKGQAQGSCDFAGTANPVTSDPSVTGCVYPSSASTAGTTTTPVTNTPGTPSTGTGTPSTGTGTPSTGTGTGTPSTGTGTPSTGTGTGTGTTTPTTSTTPTTGTTTPTTTTPYTATLGWSSVHFTKDAANNWDPMLFTKSTAGTTTTPVTNTPGTPSTGTGTGTGTPSTGTGTGTPSTSTGTGTGTTTPTTSTTPTTGTTTPTTTTPYTATPGVLGGIGTGVGPSGAGINSDDSGVIRLVDASLFSSILTLFVSGLMLWWG